MTEWKYLQVVYCFATPRGHMVFLWDLEAREKIVAEIDGAHFLNTGELYRTPCSVKEHPDNKKKLERITETKLPLGVTPEVPARDKDAHGQKIPLLRRNA